MPSRNNEIDKGKLPNVYVMKCTAISRVYLKEGGYYMQGGVNDWEWKRHHSQAHE